MIPFQTGFNPCKIGGFLIANIAAEGIRRVPSGTLCKHLFVISQKQGELKGLGLNRVDAVNLTRGMQTLAWYDAAMRQFIEFVPIAAFVAVYFSTKNMYLATGVLMVTVCAQVALEYAIDKAISKRTQMVFWIVILAGAATLAFQNEIFIKWKPTIVNWMFCAALVTSHFLMQENLLKKMLGEALHLPDKAWRNLNYGWSLGFFIAGGLNIFVAYFFSTDFWVTYKLLGGITITLIYMVITIVYLYRSGYLNDFDDETANSTE